MKTVTSLKRSYDFEDSTTDAGLEGGSVRLSSFGWSIGVLFGYGIGGLYGFGCWYWYGEAGLIDVVSPKIDRRRSSRCRRGTNNEAVIDAYFTKYDTSLRMAANRSRENSSASPEDLTTRHIRGWT